MSEKKVILSAKDIEVKFRVRDNYLTAIRNVSLDLYDGETFAIVGESGSGKSVFTKTFTGMLESNGEITNGSISARAMGVDPFQRPGAQMYKENMFRRLGKPGWEQ